MKGVEMAIGWTMVFLCIFWSKTYPSTSKVQTYVSKAGMTNSPSSMSSSFFIAQKEDSTEKEKPDSTRGERTRTIKLKDPNMALFYAVVPGIIIHGSGHFYAGKIKTGAILLASGFVGGGLFFVGALGEGLSHLDGGQTNWETGYVFMTIGAVIFVGTWTYDVIAAPIAVQKYNDKLLGKKNISLKFEIDHRRDSVKVQIVKRF